MRNFFFDIRVLSSKEFDIPVISVGNISVGGTGKTPHTEYIASFLSEDINIAVLSRGYGRKTSGYILADENSTSYQIGDEPQQIKQKFKNITVAVDGKRVRGINNLIKNDDLNLIILDDAFQHRYVKPGISILLIDYNNPITRDYILPAGSLRESASEMKRAHIIIVTKSPAEIKPIERRILEKELNLYPYQSLYFTTFDYGNPIDLTTGDITEINRESTVLLVTGIANSKPLRKYLDDRVNEVQHLKYGDHHRWRNSDIDKIVSEFNKIDSDNKIVITTEKDYVRFKDHPKFSLLKNIPFYYIPIKVRFLNIEHQKQFEKQIIDYVKKNKKSYRLYQKQDYRKA